ncbi:MAG: restriction endonuclease subunit S [Gemmatimonadota bacterium]|nr:restriction endonuclease subunit S [Gemmatimonadota bacterium]
MHRSAKLRDVCTVQIGFSARRRIRRAQQGGVLTVQLRDVAPNGSVDPARLERLQVGNAPTRYLVGAGDVLFRSRGESNTAAVLDDHFREPALAMLPLFVLRPDSPAILPEFLAWAINQPRAQRYFDRFARGTNMRMIPRAVLTDLEVTLPSLDVQRTVVALDGLARRERTLSIRAAEERRRLYTRFLEYLATKPISTGVEFPFLCDSLRLSFGIPNPARTPATRSTPHGPADID